MYKAIYDYAREHNKSVIKNRRMLQIAGYIVLDKNGKFERVEAIPQKERKEILCPYTEEFYQSNMSNPICEKLKNILPTNENTEESKQPIYHQTWIEIMKEGVKCGELMGAIYNFIIDIEKDEDLEKTLRSELSKTVIKDNEFVSFFVGNDNVVESSVWEEWFDEYMYKKREVRMTEKSIVISSLSGEKVIPISGKEKYPSIGAKQMGTGCSIASFAEESFRSYGLKDALNTPMAKEEADVIRAGIEYLLNSDHNHSDDFSLLYWYTGEDDKTPDILGRALNRNGFQMELKMLNKEKKKNMAKK
ncbi:MAG: type I-C CRISPR-associated protein Cas8c/Csd1 [Lachnospiraceae bacterium]|nr:type I-C CRISPR-associated protein Cas8c/Csd1 [Lachnospiraceae bacterium]